MIKRLLSHKRFLAIGIIVAVIIGAAGYGLALYFKAPRVMTTVLNEGVLIDYLSETGLVEANNSSRIASLVNGQVVDIAVSVGDQVDIGDDLLEISATQVDLQIKALEAQLQRVEASYNDLINPASETLESARLRVQNIENQVELAQEQLEKNQVLFAEGIISEDTLKSVENNYQSAQNQLDIARNELQLLERGGSKSQRQQYLAQMDEINYNIKQLESSRDNYLVKAPLSGTITSLPINEGDTVLAGMEIISIMDLSELLISTEVLASKAGAINPGAQLRVVDDDSEVVLELNVNKIYPTAHLIISDLGIQQKRVRLEAELPNSFMELKVGYEVDVEIVTRKKDQAVYLPKEAVYTVNGQDYVMLADGWRAREVAVETGWKTVDDVEILSGVELNQEVIVPPPEELGVGGLIRR